MIVVTADGAEVLILRPNVALGLADSLENTPLPTLTSRPTVPSVRGRAGLHPVFGMHGLNTTLLDTA